LPLSLQFARWCVSVLGIDVDPKNVEDAMFATLAGEARTMGVTSLGRCVFQRRKTFVASSFSNAADSAVMLMARFSPGIRRI